MQVSAPDRDSAWTSDGIVQSDALEHWRTWFAKRPEAPVEVSVYEDGEFDAYLASRGIGQVRMLHMRAPAQKVVHYRLAEEPAAADHLIHMLYTLEGKIDGRDETREFVMGPGEFVLVDNNRFFELDCTPHEVIDLIMPLP